MVRGAHPVRYCPLCDNPVGDHDLLEGDKAEVIRFVLVMFRLGDTLVPTATLRPETVYGVTNLWVNPDVTYVRAEVDGEIWLVSRRRPRSSRSRTTRSASSRRSPAPRSSTRRSPTRSRARSRSCPAAFVDPDMATGVVMSVPAHAPFDYVALRDLQQEGHTRSSSRCP